MFMCQLKLVVSSFQDLIRVVVKESLVRPMAKRDNIEEIIEADDGEIIGGQTKRKPNKQISWPV